MSDGDEGSREDDPPTSETDEDPERRRNREDDPPASKTDEDLERRRKELEQRERGLNDFSDELDRRESELDERERELRDRKGRLDEREAELDDRESRIAEREAELDDREVAVKERERELAERADELDRKEETLQQFVNESVRETVEEAIAGGLPTRESTGRLGNIGSLVLALVGVMLVIGGVVNSFAAELSTVPVVFANDSANLALSVLLVFSGLAANLAAVTD